MGSREISGGAQQAYGDHLAGRFWLKEQMSHVTRTVRRGILAVTQLKSDHPTPHPTQSIGYDDAYLVALQLRDVRDHELWQDGRSLAVEQFAARDTSFYDLRRDPVAFVRQPYHCLQFYLPRHVLTDVAQRNGYRFHGELDCPYGVGRSDPVIRQLGEALVPALERHHALGGLFLDHILQAMALHVVSSYGEARSLGWRANGGLAAWQERRAKEMMRADLDADLSLKRLADACGLSVSQFARAFRQTTKLSPHAWRQQRRAEKAMMLLAKSGASLSDIAVQCGFSDQSHFTRTFVRLAGISPGRWRRQNASRN